MKPGLFAMALGGQIKELGGRIDEVSGHFVDESKLPLDAQGGSSVTTEFDQHTDIVSVSVEFVAQPGQPIEVDSAKWPL